MLETLFRSRVTVKLLKYFTAHPQAEIHLRELARTIDEPASAVRRELVRLEAFGILASRSSGNQRYSKVNTAFPAFSELQALFLKTEGAIDYVRDAIAKLENVQLAFVYGAFARQPGVAVHEIQVVIVGAVDESELRATVDEIQRVLARPIRPTLFEPAEFRRLLEARDAGLSAMLDGDKIVLVARVDERD